MSKIEKIENYYSNGMLKEKGTIKNGRKDGLWTEVWVGGGVRSRSEGSYKNGNKDGKWTKFLYYIIGVFFI